MRKWEGLEEERNSGLPLPIESSRAYKGADSHPYIIKFLSNPTSETTETK